MAIGSDTQALAQGGGGCVAVFDSMEITQAMQHKDHAGHRDNSMRLVAGRGTTVRVYLDTFPSGCGPVLVRGELEYSYGGNTVTISRADNDFVIVEPTDTNAIRRGIEWKTLNYTFEAPSISSGSALPISFRFRINGSETWSLPVAHTFWGVFSRLIGGMPLAVRGEDSEAPPLIPDPVLIQPGLADLAVWAYWPFPEPSGVPASGRSGYILFPRIKNLIIERIDTFTYGAVLRLVDIIRVYGLQTKPRVDYLYGWVNVDARMTMKGATCAGRIVRPTVCHAGVGKLLPERYQSTFAHELGHDIVGNSVHPNSQIDPEVGWDVGNPDGRLRLGNIQDTEQWGVMVQGKTTAERWVLEDSYEAVFNNLFTTRPPTQLGQAIAVPVAADLDSINGHVYQFDRDAPALETSAVGAGELRILDDQDQILYQTKFDVPELSTDDSFPNEPGDGLVELPVLGDAASLELYENGVLRDTLVRSSNAPTVTITSPTPSQVLTSSLTVEWLSGDADGDDLEAYVQYSKDGEEWIPLAIAEEGATITSDTADLAASGSAFVRVVVSDGYNTTVASVDQLDLGPNRAPKAWVWSPQDGASYFAGSNVMLQGAAFDLEDGEIATASASWYSDVDGWLGTGFGLNVSSLSVGSHQIEFRVTDSDSTSTSVYVSIQVQ